MNNPENYLAERWPIFANVNPDIFLPSSKSYKTKKAFAVESFLWFLRDRKLSENDIGIPSIQAYMLFRILGDDVTGSRYGLRSNGTMSLNSFISGELNPLIRGLKEQFGSAFNLTISVVRKDPRIRNQIEMLRTHHGENTSQLHAAPIWESDETRLLQCLSACTSALRDRAILKLLIASGARGASIAKIRLNIHLHFGSDEAGSYLKVQCPACKTPVRESIVVVLRGDAYTDVMAWIKRRSAIFLHSELLFITQEGNPISAENITMMLARLSALAGYGFGFFSCHSTRMAYCGRQHARNLAMGRGVAETYDNMAASGQWAYASSAMRSYVDGKIGRFFNTDRSLSYEQFRLLSPIELHDLTHLDPLTRRSESWFCHSDILLSNLWTEACPGVLEPETQNQLRLQMSNALFATHPDFQRIIAQALDTLSPKPHERCRVLNLILEKGWIHRLTDFCGIHEEKISELRLDLRVKPSDTIQSRKEFHSINARGVREHPVSDLTHALSVTRRLRKRIRDNRVNLGFLDCGTTVHLTYPPRERNVNQVQQTQGIDDDYMDYQEMFLQTTPTEIDNESVTQREFENGGISSIASSGSSASSPSVVRQLFPDVVCTPNPTWVRTTPSTRATSSGLTPSQRHSNK